MQAIFRNVACKTKGGILRPFDKLMVLSEVEAQAQAFGSEAQARRDGEPAEPCLRLNNRGGGKLHPCANTLQKIRPINWATTKSKNAGDIG